MRSNGCLAVLVVTWSELKNWSTLVLINNTLFFGKETENRREWANWKGLQGTDQAKHKQTMVCDVTGLRSHAINKSIIMKWGSQLHIQYHLYFRWLLIKKLNFVKISKCVFLQSNVFSNFKLDGPAQQ